jgi:hypothetical protein
MPVSASRLARARRDLRTTCSPAYLINLPPEAIVALADMLHVPAPGQVPATENTPQPAPYSTTAA